MPRFACRLAVVLSLSALGVALPAAPAVADHGVTDATPAEPSLVHSAIAAAAPLALKATEDVNGGYVAAGASLRDKGGVATITIAGLPVDATVSHAYLLWDVLGSATGTGSFAGHAIQGTSMGTGGDPCWASSGNSAYMADVTQYVSGNGAYGLTAFTGGERQEGATLVVTYSAPGAASRRVQLYGGAAAINTFGGVLTQALSGFTVGAGAVKTTGVIADGQQSGNRLSINDTVVAQDFQGGDGPFWDTVTADASSVVPAGAQSATAKLSMNGDCIVWVGQVLSVPNVTDTTAPATSLAAAPSAPNGLDGWYTSAPVVSASADDGTGGSGVDQTLCVVDPATVPADYDDVVAAGGTASCPAASGGSHTFYAASIDKAGNKEAVVASKTIKLDTAAPSTALAASPSAPNGLNGWYTSAPTVSASATDGSGGSGVGTTLCVLDPASAPSGYDAVAAAGGTSTCPAIGGDGTHTYYAASVDGAGNKETAAVSKTVKVDSTKPVLTLPGTTTADATAPSGAHVPYTASASDANGVAGGGPSCTPASGAAFAIGDTTVTCSATDPAGNTQTASFTVHVNGAADELARLRARTLAIVPKPGVTLLDGLLAGAQANPGGACTNLSLYQLWVGRQFAGGELFDTAGRIAAVLGCAPSPLTALFGLSKAPTQVTSSAASRSKAKAKAKSAKRKSHKARKHRARRHRR